MFARLLLRKRNKPDRVGSSAPIDSGQQAGASASKGNEPKITKTEVLPEPHWQESSGNSSSDVIDQSDADPIEIDVQEDIWTVKFLPDGKHVVSTGGEGKIRRWRVAGGKEVGKPMDAGSWVRDLTVSQDGKWVVAGTQDGRVMVWNAKTHEKVVEFKAHENWMYAVDISADSTRIASGSMDKTVCVWSVATGQRLLGPLQHKHSVLAVKFSPHGKFIATATCRKSVRVYDGRDGQLLAEFPIYVSSLLNGSLAWTRDGEQLFALSSDGDIHYLASSTWRTLSKWRIHSIENPSGIALACNDSFVAVSGSSSFSLWDTTTHQQIRSVITCPHPIYSMAISANFVIATAGGKAITIQNLCDLLPSSYGNSRRLKSQKTNVQDIVPTVCAVDVLKSQKIRHLDESVQELRKVLVASQHAVDQLTEKIASLHADLDPQETSSGHPDSELSDPLDIPVARKITDIEQTIQQLSNELSVRQCALYIHDKKYGCEVAFADGRIYDAAQHLLEIINNVNEDLKDNELITVWLEGFTRQCISKLRSIGDQALTSQKHNEAISAYSTILSLTRSPPDHVLTGWARVALICYSASEALRTTIKFNLPRFHVHRAVCDVLEGDSRIIEAIECLRKMEDELSDETCTSDERLQWEPKFRQRCIEKLEKQGDAAMNTKNHDAAIVYYSNTMSLDPVNMRNIIVKCCKARMGFLEDELVNVTKVIEHDPSSYKAYVRKHAVLHSMGRYGEAFSIFEVMLSKIRKSPDPLISELRNNYLDATPLIREVVEQTIRDIPRALIDTTTGRLCDKAAQAIAFEELPIFDELRSSMTIRARVNYPWIHREVDKFYQYVMLSHKWQPAEPTFQRVEDISIYGLPASITIDKLLNFCKLVRSLRFRWAWSDTCCVNQADKGVQQESVVAMFQWYCRAALTIVHLLGVLSESQRKGDVWKSIWNTRGWTYQEYVASRVVQFYTEDWKPYLGLNMFNHKESPIILSEMEQATMFTTEKLATLEPGLDRVREKLYLASKRQTTREEDIAYSLFGIFDLALPVIYGEGKRAVGRLLEHILSRLDDVIILAWTGTSGSHHSYLPSDLTVYDQISPPHIPQPIETTEMDRKVMDLQSSFSDPSPIITLYEQLLDLPSLSIVSGRLRIPGLVFRLDHITPLPDSDSSLHFYRATTPILGEVQIETKDGSLAMQRLVLVHPWINPLLDEDFSGDDPLRDLNDRALRLLIRLRQSFGAMLLASQKRGRYKRVATDSFIKVQIRAETPLQQLMDSIRTVDVQ